MNPTYEQQQNNEKTKRMSCGLEISCPADIREALSQANNDGYHFIMTSVIHPRYARVVRGKDADRIISRTDRVLTSNDWSRLVVGKVNSYDVDNEVQHIRRRNTDLLKQEINFYSSLCLPAISVRLRQRNNTNLAQVLYSKIITDSSFQVWISLPMVHPSSFSLLQDSDAQPEDTWEWWNDLRRYCNYDRRLCVALELQDSTHAPSQEEINRWIGEPVKVIIIPTSLFLLNQHKQPVLSRAHQDIIQKFLNLNVQFIIRGNVHEECTYRQYNSYIHFLGKKLYNCTTLTEFSQGCEDFLQNPLQPLTEHLETMIYEVFERDQIKYVEYQRAIQRAMEDVPLDVEIPVIMVVGAGRGPLVQASINASIIARRKVKVYAVEKNPFAINTLEDRVRNEWNNEVVLINEDMRTYEPPEKADILVSELLGSFGDNELSPECLDGAQRFLKKEGISIPTSYTSYLAPLQSTKIFNEIVFNRTHDKNIQTLFETPYIVHVVNCYQISPSQSLFTFEHPNWDENKTNERFKKLRFTSTQNCVLTGFIGFFETILYKDVMLSINPQTYSENMVSWFPIIFPLQDPVQVSANSVIELSFWRTENADKVWYEWCLESPSRSRIMNPGGRSYFIKKH